MRHIETFIARSGRPARTDGTARTPHPVRTARLAVAAATTALLFTACANAPRVAAPTCARPAPLLGQYDGRAPGYQVHLRAPSESAARELVGRHALKPRSVSSSGEWIALERVSPSVIAQLRCDAAVESIQFDAWLGRLVR